MELSLSKEDLQYYITQQIEYRFPDRKARFDFKDSVNSAAFEEGLERTENCFKHIKVRGYETINSRGEAETYFNHLHMDQYSQFLYYFSNSLWKREGNLDLCSKLILLNRDLSGCWFSFKADLPEIFILVHPVGSIIGHVNVEFQDYLVIMQNTTINSQPEPYSLKLGKGLFLGGGAKIIGHGKIGDFVSIGANTLVKNPDVPENCLIYQDVNTGIVTQAPNKKEECMAQYYFKDKLQS